RKRVPHTAQQQVERRPATPQENSRRQRQSGIRRRRMRFLPRGCGTGHNPRAGAARSVQNYRSENPDRPFREETRNDVQPRPRSQIALGISRPRRSPRNRSPPRLRLRLNPAAAFLRVFLRASAPPRYRQTLRTTHDRSLQQASSSLARSPCFLRVLRVSVVKAHPSVVKAHLLSLTVNPRKSKTRRIDPNFSVISSESTAASTNGPPNSGQCA